MTHSCTYRTPPTVAAECHKAMCTEGKACKRCLVECYRRGWDRGQVLVDVMRRGKMG